MWHLLNRIKDEDDRQQAAVALLKWGPLARKARNPEAWLWARIRPRHRAPRRKQCPMPVLGVDADPGHDLRVRELLARLTLLDRKIVWWVAVDGRSFHDVGVLLGRPRAFVKRRYRRAIARLKGDA